MFFTIKNSAVATIGLLTCLVTTAAAARAMLQLHWDVVPTPLRALQAAGGLAVVLFLDGLIHGGLTLTLRERYVSRYRILAGCFRTQGAREILVAALAAGWGEEWFFRGTLLQGLLQRSPLPPWLAVLVSGALFGVLHRLPDPRLLPFVTWAILEGVLFGILYIATGSLLVCMVVHGLHDLIGFAMFAAFRRWGFILPGKAPPASPPPDASS